MQSKETSGGDDKKVYAPLSFKEAIYLATLGGAKVLNLDGKVGNFVLGKEFDALVVNLKATPGSNSNSSLQQITGESTVDIFQHETVSDLIEKFVYLGDDRNIVEIYVKGKKVFYK